MHCGLASFVSTIAHRPPFVVCRPPSLVAVSELLDLVARWIHVVAGIMWIGNSLLFNWLDRNLHDKQIWLLHSGGFYFVEKSLLEGRALPQPIHWFKWQAYTTWLSGVALLVVVYYAGGRAALESTSLVQLSHGAAILVGIGAIAGGWALYEAMQRFAAPIAPRIAAVIWVAGLSAISVALTRLLDGRAAFLHVAAMFGTIMAANVFFTIIPSQHELVAAVSSGRDADPAVSARAKRVSIHNNYFTFPVLVLMVSNHFPALYGHRWNWLALFTLIAIGVAVRHVLNIRFTFPAWKPVLASTFAAGVLALFALERTSQAPATTTVAGDPLPDRVVFADVRHVIDRRCAVCHSARPTDFTFGVAPAGVAFDTPEEVAARAARIRERAVVTRTMPPGNKTNITDRERALIGRWLDQGAPLR
jgi:uncharacterized membrane protein